MITHYFQNVTIVYQITYFLHNIQNISFLNVCSKNCNSTYIKPDFCKDNGSEKVINDKEGMKNKILGHKKFKVD